MFFVGPRGLLLAPLRRFFSLAFRSFNVRRLTNRPSRAQVNRPRGATRRRRSAVDDERRLYGRRWSYDGRRRHVTAMNVGDQQPGGGRDEAAAVNYKTRKRPAHNTTVYTITRPDSPGGQQQQQQRRRPRTWTCGGGGGGGGSSLTRSRTFTSNYERAISSLLWQPYECRSSSNSLDDDGDVAVWLNSTGRYEPLSSRSSLSLSSIVPR